MKTLQKGDIRMGEKLKAVLGGCLEGFVDVVLALGLALCFSKLLGLW